MVISAFLSISVKINNPRRPSITSTVLLLYHSPWAALYTLWVNDTVVVLKYIPVTSELSQMTPSPPPPQRTLTLLL
jgi:hypothetical protein